MDDQAPTWRGERDLNENAFVRFEHDRVGNMRMTEAPKQSTRSNRPPEEQIAERQKATAARRTETASSSCREAQLVRVEGTACVPLPSPPTAENPACSGGS